MALEDKVLGGAFLAIASAVFLYYTLWTLVSPFVDADHVFQTFFPDRYYAVAAPLVLLVAGLSGVTALIGLVMVKSSKGKKPAVAAQEPKKEQ